MSTLDTTTHDISIRFELYKLNKNGKKSLSNICKNYNYNYDKNSAKIKLIHNILKYEFSQQFIIVLLIILK